MGNTNGSGGTDRYEQLKVAVQDTLIELDISPQNLKDRVDKNLVCDENDPEAKLSVKVCQKLIDAGVLEGV